MLAKSYCQNGFKADVGFCHHLHGPHATKKSQNLSNKHALNFRESYSLQRGCRTSALASDGEEDERRNVDIDALAQQLTQAAERLRYDFVHYDTICTIACHECNDDLIDKMVYTGHSWVDGSSLMAS